MIDKRFLSRHTLWHLRGMARFARKHPEALLRARSRGTYVKVTTRAELTRIAAGVGSSSAGENVGSIVTSTRQGDGGVGRTKVFVTWHEWMTP